MTHPFLTSQLASDLEEYQAPNTTRKVGLFLSLDELEILEKLCLIYRSSQARVIRTALLTLVHQLPDQIKEAMNPKTD